MFLTFDWGTYRHASLFAWNCHQLCWFWTLVYPITHQVCFLHLVKLLAHFLWHTPSFCLEGCHNHHYKAISRRKGIIFQLWKIFSICAFFKSWFNSGRLPCLVAQIYFLVVKMTNRPWHACISDKITLSSSF